MNLTNIIILIVSLWYMAVCSLTGMTAIHYILPAVGILLTVAQIARHLLRGEV